VIPLDRTVIPFEIYQVQNRSVSSLGELDADALNDALRELARVTEDPEGNLGRALQGLAEATEALAQRDTQLESLLGNAALVGDVLASRSEELGRIIDSGSQILGELQRRRESLKEFVRGTDRVAGELADLISDTRGDLDPALRDLHTALEVVRANFADLEDALVVLSVGSESFGRVFTQGEWGDVFLEGVELPLPIPASGASDPTGLSAIFGVAR
jgi:phospholipid/cholesterol/gamma-HCH transport system substrate-binding protein